MLVSVVLVRVAAIYLYKFTTEVYCLYKPRMPRLPLRFVTQQSRQYLATFQLPTLIDRLKHKKQHKTLDLYSVLKQSYHISSLLLYECICCACQTIGHAKLGDLVNCQAFIKRQFSGPIINSYYCLLGHGTVYIWLAEKSDSIIIVSNCA